MENSALSVAVRHPQPSEDIVRLLVEYNPPTDYITDSLMQFERSTMAYIEDMHRVRTDQ